MLTPKNLIVSISTLDKTLQIKNGPQLFTLESRLNKILLLLNWIKAENRRMRWLFTHPPPALTSDLLLSPFSSICSVALLLYFIHDLGPRNTHWYDLQISISSDLWDAERVSKKVTRFTSSTNTNQPSRGCDANKIAWILEMGRCIEFEEIISHRISELIRMQNWDKPGIEWHGHGWNSITFKRFMVLSRNLAHPWEKVKGPGIGK